VNASTTDSGAADDEDRRVGVQSPAAWSVDAVARAV
jgi:hypothetical protein